MSAALTLLCLGDNPRDDAAEPGRGDASLFLLGDGEDRADIGAGEDPVEGDGDGSLVLFAVPLLACALVILGDDCGAFLACATTGDGMGSLDLLVAGSGDGCAGSVLLTDSRGDDPPAVHLLVVALTGEGLGSFDILCDGVKSSVALVEDDPADWWSSSVFVKRW